MNIYPTLTRAFPQLEFKANYSLQAQTYFKIGGSAEVYLELASKPEIIEVIKFCRQNQIKLTILGGASNVVIKNQGISGLVLHLKNNQFQVLNQPYQGKDVIRAGAGIKTATLVQQSVELGYTGLEYFLGVPGTLGGAVYNNAHYLEHLISQYIYRVEVIGHQGEAKWLHQPECEFGYDQSRFQNTSEIILSVELALEKDATAESKRKIAEVTQYRATTQPLGHPSSGCIFKNTPNTPQLKKLFPQYRNRDYMPTGFLIDQAGLKGIKVGDIEVSNKHAAFFINRGQGTAQDLKKLINLVKKTVQDKFGVELEEEVFYLE